MRVWASKLIAKCTNVTWKQFNMGIKNATDFESGKKIAKKFPQKKLLTQKWTNFAVSNLLVLWEKVLGSLTFLQIVQQIKNQRQILQFFIPILKFGFVFVFTNKILHPSNG